MLGTNKVVVVVVVVDEKNSRPAKKNFRHTRTNLEININSQRVDLHHA